MAKQKDAFVNVPVTAEQKERWKKHAEARQQSLPSFVRYCVEVYLMMVEKKKNLK